MSLYEDIVSGKEKLSLVGLGYVGMPIAVAFARKIQVVGFDLNADKIGTLCCLLCSASCRTSAAASAKDTASHCCCQHNCQHFFHRNTPPFIFVILIF